MTWRDSIDQQRLSTLIENTWRIRCPRGHHGLRDKQGPTVYCPGCNSSYDYDDLIDSRKESPPPSFGTPRDE